MIYINNYGWRWGNNLFQIACMAGLAKANNDNFIIPLWTYNKFLKRPLQEKNPPYNISTIFDEGNTFQYRQIPYKKNMAINGYFQSEKYFAHCKEYIKEIFEPSDEIKKYINNKYGHLMFEETIGSIHIRRTDYLKFPDHHPVVGMNYLMKATKEFPDNYRFVIFSDDLEWCKENLSGDKFIYIDQETDIHDFFLMSMLHNNIICNSTFSWWAAWLNNNPEKKIVAPKKWFGPAYAHYDTSDLYPPEWIQI